VLLYMQKTDRMYITKLTYMVQCKLVEYSKLHIINKPEYDNQMSHYLKELSLIGNSKPIINRILNAVYMCELFINADLYSVAYTSYFRNVIKWELIQRVLNPSRLLMLYKGDYDKVAEYLIESGL